MSDVRDNQPKPRMLFVGPGFHEGVVGGLRLALDDLTRQLERRGWHIETLSGFTKSAVAGSLHPTDSYSRLEFLQQWPLCHRAWSWLPPSLRHLITWLLMPARMFENAARNFSLMEQALATGSYDLVLLYVDGAHPGAVALMTERHPRVALLSLTELANELTWWRKTGWLIRLRAGRRHPSWCQPIPIEKIKLAIFPSRAWQEAATAAGLPAAAARVAYFGLPLPPPVPRSSVSRARLLWVGRLAREKGLHLFLKALPRIRQQIGEVTLTIVAEPGSAYYRALILKLIERYHLEDVVMFKPPVPRSDLQQLYAEHDMLLFYSVFSEPVALVMMEAMAAGLPVVASQARSDARLTQDQVTCLCYNPHRLETVVSAIVQMHKDDELRLALAARAQQLVRESFSLEAMGQDYDQLLSEFVAAHHGVASREAAAYSVTCSV